MIGFQFVISITLIIGSLFVFLQNKFIGNVDLGYDKENILEVRLSMGTALSRSDLYKALLLEHPDIKDVAFNEFKFVSDELNPGYPTDIHFFDKALDELYNKSHQQGFLVTILWMFNSSFLKVVLVGFVISVPVSYYGVSQWLQSFAYKTPLYLWVFLIALAAIAILTTLTVTIQSYRVVTSNPAPKL